MTVRSCPKHGIPLVVTIYFDGRSDEWWCEVCRSEAVPLYVGGERGEW